MNESSKWESVKRFFERIGKRNLMIAGAIVLIGVAVALNWAFFTGDDDKNDGFSYDASAGMSGNYGTEMTTTVVGNDTTA